MAKQILTGLDLLALPSLTTPKTGSVGFGAKTDGLYQKIGTVENKLSTTAELLDRVKTAVPLNAKFTDTTYGVATTSANGLMSSADKTKLNGIATGANNYSLPTASSSVLGGIKVGSRLTISSGTLSANVQSDNNFTNAYKTKLDGIAAEANKYSLPTASSTTLGGVKIGSNISISSGVISVAAPYTHPATHPASMITGLHASATTGVAGSVAWGNVTGKPSTFAPSAHTLGSHSDVTITSIASGEILKWDGTAWINNTLAEAGISASSHSHSWSQITSKPSTFAPSAHNHTIAQVTGLQSALDGKAATSHTHTFASLTNKPTTIAGYNITDAYTKAEVDSLASYVGAYSFPNGFLVKTNVARTENSMLVLHIKGNSYGSAVPIDTFVQLYNYVTNDALISTGALNNGYKINEVKAFYYNNLVYFWVPQQSGSQTMHFQLLKATVQVNRVDSVTNAAVPTSGVEKMVTIIPRTAWFENTLTNVSQLSNDSGYITASASITGNAATATKLATARTINGTSFNGTAAITTANWGTARNIGIVNSDGTGTAVTTSVNGSGNVNLKLPATIKASLTGNASTATTATNCSRSVVAGDGLTGGGALSANRTLTLGTPSAITLSSTNSVAASSHTHSLALGGTASQYLNGATALVTIPTITAGNGLSGGGQLTASRTLTLGTPSTLTKATTNGVTGTSHTHAITTTTVGAANTIVATDASGGVRGNAIKVGANWSLELSGTELQIKYGGVVKQRMLSDGSFVAEGEVSAFSEGAGGGTGGSYDRLDDWTDYDATKEDWVLSALLGKDLDTRVTNLNNSMPNIQVVDSLPIMPTAGVFYFVKE